jgi:hypothetical protein
VVRIHTGGNKPFVQEECKYRKTLLALGRKANAEVSVEFGKGTVLNSN